MAGCLAMVRVQASGGMCVLLVRLLRLLRLVVLTAWFMLWQPTWNLLAMMCWDITYGLDVQDPNPQIWSEEIGEHSCHSTNCSNWTKTLWRPFQHFHVLLEGCFLELSRCPSR